MAPAFGTSGLRGRVVDLTQDLVANHTRAFLAACPNGGAVHVGWDLRPSSPQIAAMVIGAVQAAGLRALRHGPLPTPALAQAAMAQGHAAIMITGSHIPADRNGLKFYVPQGEITKAQETAILAALGQDWPQADQTTPAAAPTVTDEDTALAAFAARYVQAYGPRALAGMRVGVYQHSSVARDVLPQVLAALGATPVALGWSDRFIPVDTEAVSADTRAQLAAWCAEHRLDALVSTDGDADRPLMTDANGTVIVGDVLGAITARALQATAVCTPVSSNTMIEKMGDIARVQRTRIGSPHVIAAMETMRRDTPGIRVVGYEANGGFLLGFAANGPDGVLPPLMTRDCILPILAPLAAARAQGVSLAQLCAALPARFTAADRVQDVPTAKTRALLDQLQADPAARARFFDTLPPEQATDLTDGLRVQFSNGEIVHLRPSGNAPECRCYAEANTPDRATNLVTHHLKRLAKALGK